MKRIILFCSMLILILSCSTSDSSDIPESEWLVDRNDVTGLFNLFPLSNKPIFKSIPEVSLADGDLVAMVNFGNEIRVYPYTFTNPFEVINDDFQGTKISVSYCPITKSGICFDRNMKGSVSIFRASGYLYNDNLMPYDEETESIWSQMRQQAVFGPLKGIKFKTYNLIETQWKTVKENFSSAKVFVGDSNGVSKNTTAPEPGGGIENGAGAPDDGSFVYGVFYNNTSDNLAIFEYKQFAENKLFDLNLGDRNLIVVGDASRKIISSYFTETEGQFEEISGEFPIVMVNKENGSKYNIFGVAVTGADAGRRLESPRSYVAIWWAWKEFYNNFKFNGID